MKSIGIAGFAVLGLTILWAGYTIIFTDVFRPVPKIPGSRGFLDNVRVDQEYARKIFDDADKKVESVCEIGNVFSAIVIFFKYTSMILSGYIAIAVGFLKLQEASPQSGQMRAGPHKALKNPDRRIGRISIIVAMCTAVGFQLYDESEHSFIKAERITDIIGEARTDIQNATTESEERRILDKLKVRIEKM